MRTGQNGPRRRAQINSSTGIPGIAIYPTVTRYLHYRYVRVIVVAYFNLNGRQYRKAWIAGGSRTLDQAIALAKRWRKARRV